MGYLVNELCGYSWITMLTLPINATICLANIMPTVQW